MFIYASVITALIYTILVNFSVFCSADTFLLHIWSIKFILMGINDEKAFCSALLNRICVFTHFSQETRVHRTSEALHAPLVSFQISVSCHSVLIPIHASIHIAPPGGARKVKGSEISKLSCRHCKLLKMKTSKLLERSYVKRTQQKLIWQELRDIWGQAQQPRNASILLLGSTGQNKLHWRDRYSQFL